MKLKKIGEIKTSNIDLISKLEEDYIIIADNNDNEENTLFFIIETSEEPKYKKWFRKRG